jgi:hypothetical protein
MPHSVVSSPLRYGRFKANVDPVAEPNFRYFGRSIAKGAIVYVTERMARRYTIRGRLTKIDNGPKQATDVLIFGGRNHRHRLYVVGS